MFTGIIKCLGKVELQNQGIKVIAPGIISQIEIGSSVCVSGVCLTATQIDRDGFVSEIMPQTLRLTTLGDLRAGDKVNLEPSLRLGDEIGGHFIYGHVDGVGEVVKLYSEGDARILSIQAPETLSKYLVPQGSIAVDGVSLTIASSYTRGQLPPPMAESEGFSVSLIQETLERTTLSDLKAGDKVNLEADMMIKYFSQIHEHE